MHEAGMTDGSRLALVVAFYLSKFDTDALTQLGYTTFKEAFADIAGQLGVKPGSVKNKRDDFDPMFSNARAGWHQRELGPSRVKVLNLFNDLSFDALSGFVRDLLKSPTYRESVEVKDILDVLKRERDDSGRFVPRGATGRMAEELFLEWFREGKTPFRGSIEDKRDAGCGYDFLIRDGNARQLVEVKGLSNEEGGMLLTDKEWQTALVNSDYAIVLFANLQADPKLQVIRNPALLLNPRRTVNLAVTVAWQVSAAQLVANKHNSQKV